MNDLFTWAPVILVAGTIFLIFEILGPRSPVARALTSGLCIALTFRYIYWRVLFTVPLHQNLAQYLFSRTFLLVELCALTSSLLVYFFMSRTISRSDVATLHIDSSIHDAPTDVFIATFNESFDILERTIVGALSLHHPDLRVWVLDDGNRPWVRDLAASLGVQYLSRIKGKHAKAGNVNNGVRQALATSRPPEFFLLLDADFIPHRNLLRRVLGLFDDPTIGIVQTPQHFFNSDPIQSNLFCAAIWPDEQRFFFNCLLPSKDAWGAAFCCGTSAVFRSAAFVAAGGMATETVTEDMLTTFKFEEFGYRTVFLNERLSLGLAPESLLDFISQRSRWCLGAMQQIFTRWSFFGPARISLINRLAFFDTVLYWVSGAAFKLLLLSAPILYWFTGTTVLHATAPDLIYWLAPMFLANLLFMYYLADNRVLPIMTDITQLLTSFVICRTVVSGLLRPFGRPFKVTAKGVSTTGITVQWGILWRFALLSFLTLLGLFLHIGRFSPAHGEQGYAPAILWSLINAAILALTAAACIEPPHRRRDERFDTNEPVSVRLSHAFSDSASSDGPLDPQTTILPCTLCDISLSGAAITAPSGWKSLSGPAELILPGTGGDQPLALPFTVVTRRDDVLTLQFHPHIWVRHALISKIFTGEYHREIDEINAPDIFTTLARALIS